MENCQLAHRVSGGQETGSRRLKESDGGVRFELLSTTLSDKLSYEEYRAWILTHQEKGLNPCENPYLNGCPYKASIKSKPREQEYLAEARETTRTLEDWLALGLYADPSASSVRVVDILDDERDLLKYVKGEHLERLHAMFACRDDPCIDCPICMSPLTFTQERIRAAGKGESRRNMEKFHERQVREAEAARTRRTLF